MKTFKTSLIATLAIIMIGLASCQKAALPTPASQPPPTIHTSTFNDTLDMYLYSLQFRDTTGTINLTVGGFYVLAYSGTTLSDSIYENTKYTNNTSKYEAGLLDTITNKRKVSIEDSAFVSLKLTFSALQADTIKVYDHISTTNKNNLDAVFAVTRMGTNSYSITKTYERPLIKPTTVTGIYSGIHISNTSSPFVMTVFYP